MKESVHLINEDDLSIIYHIDTNKFYKASGTLKEVNSLESFTKFADIEKLIPQLTDRLNKLTLVVTSACNLKCKYCFADYVHKDKNKKMDINVYINAFDFILSQYPKGINNITIFGGEPLLEFKVFKDGIQYYEKKCKELNLEKAKIGIVTNGTIINDDIIEFLNKYDNISVTFSLDGSKEMNDFARVDNELNGVYDKVYSNIKNNIHKFKFITNIEVTLNKNHVNSYKKGEGRRWIKELLDIGLNGITIGIVETKDESLGLIPQDEIVYREMYSEMIDYLFEELVKGRIFIPADIIQGIKALISKKSIPLSCTAGLNNLTIGAEGEILPCYTFYGEKEYLMGNVNEDITDRYNEVQESFTNHYYEKPTECTDCWIRNICNVWCRGLSNSSNKNPLTILRPRCWTGQVLYERIIINLVKLSKDEVEYTKFKETFRKISTTYRLTNHE